MNRRMSTKELDFVYPEYRCIFCGVAELVGGPRAGIMRNMNCTRCGAVFNLVAPDCRHVVREGARIIAVPPLGYVVQEPRRILPHQPLPTVHEVFDHYKKQ